MTNIIGYSITMNDNYSKVMNDFKKRLDELEQKVGSTITKTAKWNEQLNKIGTTLIKRVTLPLLGMGAYALKQVANFDEIRHRLQFVTGSAEKAALAMKDVKKMALTSGISFESYAVAEQRMLALGYSVDQSSKFVKQFGKIAEGTGKPIEDIASAFIRLELAAKKTGGVPFLLLRRLQSAGIGVYEVMKEISIRNGMTAKEFDKRIANNQASVKLLEKAFEELAKRQPFASIEQNLQRSHNILRYFAASIVEAYYPAENLGASFEKLNDYLGELALKFEEFTKEHPKLVKIGVAFAAILAALAPALKIVMFIYNMKVAIATLKIFKSAAVITGGEVAAAMGTATAATGGLAAALGRLALLSTGLTVLAGAIYLVYKNIKDFDSPEAIRGRNVLQSAGVGMMPSAFGYAMPMPKRVIPSQLEASSGGVTSLVKPITQASKVTTTANVSVDINDRYGHVSKVTTNGTVEKIRLNKGQYSDLSRNLSRG
jgi:hypothetical protein